MNDEVGKYVATRRYVHASAVNTLGGATQSLVLRGAAMANVSAEVDYNVVRIDDRDHSIAFLSYPDFFDNGCPTLAQSWRVDLSSGLVARRRYEASLNPPVLHRKELLLCNTDSRRLPFERLTSELEALGCFDDPVRIGFRIPWEQLLQERGFRIIGHTLAPIGNDEEPCDVAFAFADPFPIARHLTALSRSNFSAPVQLLQRYGFLDGSRSLFDYGCGKGDDLRGLLSLGLNAFGWDPHYAPDGPIATADIVNLGFVLNVIEDPVERRHALRQAHSFASELLVVSTMIATDNPKALTLYGDGVLTSRATFQKYFRQSELREYLSSNLGDDPVSVAPGIFFVFRNRASEQRFQATRYRVRVRPSPQARPLRLERKPTASPKVARPDPYDVYRHLLEPLWNLYLELGREPDPSEVHTVSAIEDALGSLRKALKLTVSHNDIAQLEKWRRQRIDDLTVFLALEQFQRRKPYKTLEPRLQRDIRSFFGDYRSAQDRARHLLFQVSDPVMIDECCERAAEDGLGWLETGHSLHLHSSLVERLPAPLRVYVGCAAVLFGDVNESDVVKIHIRSGKVSFMKYDDFFGQAVPKMVQRTKVNLRTLDLSVYSYGDTYPAAPLYLKSRVMHEELPQYAEQLAFDEALQSLEIDLSGFGPSADDLQVLLDKQRYYINGFRLERASSIPTLDDQCGRFLTYRKLIECGDTQAATRVANLPTNPESYAALLDLATNVLDPVIEYYGKIELTYGFCSRELGKHISGRVAPELDQHASHERKARDSSFVCNRLGAAVDFFVADENMEEVAQWVAANTPFDRLYYYGSTRPIHVSYGPSSAREAYRLVAEAGKRAIPRRWNIPIYPRPNSQED